MMFTRLSTFPAGFAGAGLLLLRLQASIMLAIVTFCYGAHGFMWFAAITGPLFAALLAGRYTRLASLVAMLLLIGVSVATHGIVMRLLVTGTISSAALALLGAGAYSADALHFGRRSIKIRLRPPVAPGDKPD
jgi:hypothetical protein